MKYKIEFNDIMVMVYQSLAVAWVMYIIMTGNWSIWTVLTLIIWAVVFIGAIFVYIQRLRNQYIKGWNDHADWARQWRVTLKNTDLTYDFKGKTTGIKSELKVQRNGDAEAEEDLKKEKE